MNVSRDLGVQDQEPQRGGAEDVETRGEAPGVDCGNYRRVRLGAPIQAESSRRTTQDIQRKDSSSSLTRLFLRAPPRSTRLRVESSCSSDDGRPA